MRQTHNEPNDTMLKKMVDAYEIFDVRWLQIVVIATIVAKL